MTAPSAEALLEAAKWFDWPDSKERLARAFDAFGEAACRRGIEACARWHDDRADRYAAEGREAAEDEQKLVAQYGESGKGLFVERRRHLAEQERKERYAAEQHRALAPPQEGS